MNLYNVAVLLITLILVVIFLIGIWKDAKDSLHDLENHEKGRHAKE